MTITHCYSLFLTTAAHQAGVSLPKLVDFSSQSANSAEAREHSVLSKRVLRSSCYHISPLLLQRKKKSSPVAD